MKVTLPERSLVIKPLLDRVTSEILIAGKDTIAMIILFGSYARGDWVSDEYTKGHITYSYQSDLDIMVVLKKGKHIAYAEPRIEKRLERMTFQSSVFGGRIMEIPKNSQNVPS